MGAGLRRRDALGRAGGLRRRARGRAGAVPRADVARGLDPVALCRLAADPAAPARRFCRPNVPVLILSGRDDLRTPLEDARRTAAQYPNARLLAVPGVGHSVLRTDPTGCARHRARRVRARPDRLELLGPPGADGRRYAPATIGALSPTRLSGLPGRTLSALTVTLIGIAFDAAAHGRETFRLPGLAPVMCAPREPR